MDRDTVSCLHHMIQNCSTTCNLDTCMLRIRTTCIKKSVITPTGDIGAITTQKSITKTTALKIHSITPEDSQNHARSIKRVRFQRIRASWRMLQMRTKILKRGGSHPTKTSLSTKAARGSTTPRSTLTTPPRRKQLLGITLGSLTKTKTRRLNFSTSLQSLVKLGRLC